MSERKISPRQALFRHTILILASFVMIYPLLWMVMSSFKPDTLIFSDPMALPETIGFDNYVNGWNALAVSFTTFYKNSFFIAIMAVIGNVMACSLTAYAFARLEFRGRRIWFALMMGTLMLPYHVTLVPQYVLFLNIGWVNTFLPLIVPKFLAVDAFFIFLMVQFFRGIPREIDEAAIMDDFLGPLIYLNNMESYTVPLALRAFIDSSGGQSLYGAMFAMSTLSLVPVFIVFLAFQKLLIRGVAMGALKR